MHLVNGSFTSLGGRVQDDALGALGILSIER